MGSRYWEEQCNLTMVGFPIEHQAKIIIKLKYVSPSPSSLPHLCSSLKAVHSFTSVANTHTLYMDGMLNLDYLGEKHARTHTHVRLTR